MHVQSQIIVHRSSPAVARFLDDASTLAMWDRSVATIVQTPSGSTAVGFTFDTIAAKFYVEIFKNLDELVGDEKSAGAQRAMEAMLRMKKIDIAELRRVHHAA